MKRCSRCKTDKPTEEFCKDKGSKDQLNGICRECDMLRRARPEYLASTITHEYRQGSRRGATIRDVTGATYNLLTAIKPLRSHKKSGLVIWLWACECGNTKEATPQAVRTGSPKSCGCHRRGNGGSGSYKQAHRRVRSQKGSASFHPCVDCGNLAEEWSYDGLDPDEFVGPVKKGESSVCRYSQKPEHYHPRCRPCHYLFDRGTPLPTEPPVAAPRPEGAPSYGAAHKRVAKARGRAKDHVCVDCGGPASEWSYDGTDPNPLEEVRRKYASSYARIALYSADLSRYEPRCRRCHWAEDHGRNELTRLASSGKLDTISSKETGLRMGTPLKT